MVRSGGSRTLSTAFAVLALGGWAGLGYAWWSSTQTERELQDRITTLEATSVASAAERERLRSTLEASAARLRDELIIVTQSWHKAAADLTAARAELAALRGSPGSGEGASPDATSAPTPGPTVTSPEAETPAVRIAPKPQPAVVSAQKALTALGYGALEADGVLGPKTRTALQEFQRDKQLAITGELGPETAQELGIAATVATQ